MWGQRPELIQTINAANIQVERHIPAAANSQDLLTFRQSLNVSHKPKFSLYTGVNLMLIHLLGLRGMWCPGGAPEHVLLECFGFLYFLKVHCCKPIRGYILSTLSNAKGQWRVLSLAMNSTSKDCVEDITSNSMSEPPDTLQLTSLWWQTGNTKWPQKLRSIF